MRVPLSWLHEHLETEAPLERIAATLNAIGLEVEAVIRPGAALAPFRTARILTANPHPNADRLRVCEVDAGFPDPVQVVCGAPNARAGLATIFAPPGATIPATGTVLKVGEIRGVESRGMLCSLRELGLGEEQDGIAELPDDAPAGTPYAAYAGLDDPILDVAVTANRGDALSIRGVARDLAAAGLGTLRPLPATAIEPRGRSALAWAIEDPGCPWVLGRTIRNVRNGPSPAWLQARLAAVGQRPISALVDATNLFTLGLGRPLHVFDAARVTGDTLTIRPGGGAFEALGGDRIETTPDDLVIADDAGIQSLAGIKGGTATAATDATRDIFLECALFDPIRIARTGRRLNVASDARARFERGIDRAALPALLDAATHLILELCGGEPSAIVSAGREPAWQRDATLRYDRLATLGGLALPPETARARLAALGFEERAATATSITVAVPSWRADIATRLPIAPQPDATPDATPAGPANPTDPGTPALQASADAAEAEADLVEEILRLGGLDAIAPVSLPPLGPVPRPSLPEPAARAATLRRALAARGLLECVSFSFMDGRTADAIAPLDPTDAAALTLANPIASDLDRLRPTPLASLVAAAARNAARGAPDSALFEIGPGFTPHGPLAIAAGLRTGRTPRHPGHPAEPLAWPAARADLFACLALLGVPPDALTTAPIDADAPDAPLWHPGRAGEVRQGPKTLLGRYGALHPAACAALGLDGPAIGFELFLDRIAPARRRRPKPPTLSGLMPVRRDFAFVTATTTPAETLLRAARTADRTLIAGVTLFDAYEGDRLPPGQKSLGLEVTLQPTDHTLTDPEIEAVSAKIVAAVTKATGAVLR